ncbi:acyl-CoA carboxylase subunit epsilon [Streptomyces lasalocidi]
MPAECDSPARAVLDRTLSPTDLVVRLTRGHAEPEELAALTTILLVCAQRRHRPADTAGARRPTASWCGPHVWRGFRSPHSWQTTTA